MRNCRCRAQRPLFIFFAHPWPSPVSGDRNVGSPWLPVKRSVRRHCHRCALPDFSNSFRPKTKKNSSTSGRRAKKVRCASSSTLFLCQTCRSAFEVGAAAADPISTYLILSAFLSLHRFDTLNLCVPPDKKKKKKKTTTAPTTGTSCLSTFWLAICRCDISAAG